MIKVDADDETARPAGAIDQGPGADDHFSQDEGGGNDGDDIYCILFESSSLKQHREL